MAAITSAIVGAAGLGMSAYQMVDAKKNQKKAQNELNSYERQVLTNAFENVKISTMGSDILRDENARNTANLVNASKMGGARTIIGAVPKIVASSNEVNQTAAKMVDDQIINREYAIAGDKTRIQGITEQRDIANISALSSQVDASKQDFWNGVNGALSSASYLGQGLKDMKKDNKYVDDSVVNNVSGPKVESSKYDFSTLKLNTPYSSISENPYMFNDNSNDLINKYNRSTKNQIF